MDSNIPIFEVPDWQKINRAIDKINNDSRLSSEQKKQQIHELIEEQQFEKRIDEVRRKVELSEKGIEANPYDRESNSEYERQEDYLELLMEAFEKVQKHAASKLCR